MAVIKTDTFTEASDTPLENHISDSGGGWSGETTAQFDVLGATNELTVTGGSYYAPGDETPASADYWASTNGKTGSTATGERIGVCVRKNSTDGYVAWLQGSDAWKLYKIVSGSWTLLDSGNKSGFSASTYYDIKLQMNGTSWEFWIDGVSVSTGTDSSVSAVNKHAMYGRSDSGSSRCTRFDAEDLVVGDSAVRRPRIQTHGHGIQSRRSRYV